jgi:predicted MFS family arabinose efflux permease
VLGALGALVLLEAPVPLIAVAIAVSLALRGAFEPVAYAVVADVAPKHQRVAAFGLQRMGTNLGWAIGPAVGGLLWMVVPYGIVFFAAAPILFACAIVVARLAEPPRTADANAVKVSLRDAFATAMSRSDVALVLACALVFSIAHGQLFSTLPIYATAELSLRKSDIGLVYMVNGLAVLVFQVPAVGVIGRLSAQRALIGGSLLYAISFVIIGMATGPLSLASAVLVLTLGEVVMAPAQQALIVEQSDPARLGRAFGLLGILQMAGIALAPIVGGIAYDQTGHDGPALWFTLAGLPVLVLLGYMQLPRLLRQAAPPA